MKTDRLSINYLLLIAVLIGLVYGQTFDDPFVYDDKAFMLQNPLVHDLASLPKLMAENPARALTMASFALNYHFGGEDVRGYHLVNILIHLLATWVVFFLVRALTKDTHSPSSRTTAFVAAAIFAVHPLQTQAVCYTWQRAALLAALFYLAAMFAYIQARRRSERRGFWWIVALTSGAAACFCKENAASLVGALFLLEWLFLRGYPRPSRLFYSSFLALAAIVPVTVLIMRGLYGENTFDPYVEDIGPVAYLMTQVPVTLTYLLLLIWPVGQNLDHHTTLVTSPTDPVFLVSFILLAASVALIPILLRKDKVLFFCYGFFFLALSVEAVAFVLDDVMVEHRLYLPMFAFALAAANLLSKLKERAPKSSWAPAITVIIALAGAAWLRAAVWRSPLSLWDDAVQKSPEKARPYFNRGVALRELGRREEAGADFDRTIELKPDYVPALLVRGMFHQNNGEPDAAVADYSKAIALEPGLVSAYNNRGSLYLAAGRYAEAFSDFDRAVNLRPTYSIGYHNRGIAHRKLGRSEEALADFQQACKLDPNYAEAHCRLAETQLELNRPEAAIEAFQRCLAMKPGGREATLGLAEALYKTGRKQEALTLLEKAITRDPDFTEAWFSRGVIRYHEGDFAGAIADLNRFIEREPRAEAYYRRGLAKQAVGDVEGAKADYITAKKLQDESSR
ncbi:MAG: tetratricopeptide repeat protein [Acidobacteriota bacterium]|nr:tetratricopeptide repeat protein [Acidobacteriota bacterium]